MAVEPSVDLRDMFGPARDQTPRPTCVAFAASDTHAALRGCEPLSAEWAHYQTIQRTGEPPDGGVYMDDMRETLRADGQPYETHWPYINRDIDLATWKPPAAAPGALFKRESDRAVATFDDICGKLDEGVPVLIIMLVSEAFDAGWDDDYVIDSDEPPSSRPAHAVVAVGYGMRGSDRLLLVRNSWGSGWGDDGYAWISENYLKPRLEVASVLTSEI